MNDEEKLIELLNDVLGMAVGEARSLRERHIGAPCTAHRYDDGWTLFIDPISDRHFWPEAFLGWHFNHVEDIADFVAGTMGNRHVNFVLLGTRS